MRTHPANPNHPLPGLACALLVAAGSALHLALAPVAHSQGDALIPAEGLPDQPEGPYDGRFIASVTILVAEPGEEEFNLADGATLQLVRNQIRTGKGSREYAQRIVADDIIRLNRLGRFQSVEHLLTERDDGTLDVTFRLQKQPVIADVQVTGNRRISTRKLAQAVEFLAGTPVDQFELDRAARAIEDLYRERGFYLAKVSVNLGELMNTGIVLFEVREGLRTKITDIRFDGNTSFSDKVLGREIETSTANLFFNRGPLDEYQLRADERSLARFYKDRGYLDARVGSQIQTSPDSREAIITFYIEEGPIYSLGEIITQYEDAGPTGPVLSSEQIIGLIDMKPGDTYSTRKVEAAIEKIESAYGQIGYVDARVQRQETRDTREPVVDIVIGISQGEQYRTGNVTIVGNSITRQDEVRKYIQNRPDRPLDKNAVEETRGILTATDLFNRQQFPPRTAILRPDPAMPTHRDILVEVTEHNTGSFGFGAAVNSDAGLSGRFSFTQRNFDVTDTPDSVGDFFSGKSFRGGGQTFSIEASPGTRVGAYAISLADNAINDSVIGGSVSASIRTRDFNEYDERRAGLSGALTRRFGERWRGSFDARYQNIDIDEVEPSSTTDLFDVEGENNLTALGFGLRRNTIPPQERFRPTRGSIINFGVEQIGAIGGDYDFTKLNADHTVFLAISEDYRNRKTVLRLTTEARYIPQGMGDAPIFERYYLGGKSMRGFDFRTVSPRGVRQDNGLPSDDPIGGTWSFFWGAELQQPLYEDTFALAFFLDTGTVAEEFTFDDYRVSVGTGLRVYIPFLSPAPLAFDFGFPLVKEDTDEKRLFTFDIDLPY